jgi:hypothetical protein
MKRVLTALIVVVCPCFSGGSARAFSLLDPNTGSPALNPYIWPSMPRRQLDPDGGLSYDSRAINYQF